MKGEVSLGSSHLFSTVFPMKCNILQCKMHQICNNQIQIGVSWVTMYTVILNQLLIRVYLG